MSDNGNDIGAFMAGFVIGGLVGAATALILAPQSGEETRTQISTRGAEIRMAGEERLNEYRTKAEEAVLEASANIQEQARIVLDEGKARVNLVVEKSNQSVDNLTDSIEDEG